MAAELSGINRNTATYYFQRLRELIFQYQEEHTMRSGETEVDESYSVKRPLGLEALRRARGAWSGRKNPRIRLRPLGLDY